VLVAHASINSLGLADISPELVTLPRIHSGLAPLLTKKYTIA
jgi:hypothetical protein